MPTTAQVAKIANVSPQSVRNWSREFADLFSPAARGEGSARLFNERDVEVMCAIADLKKSGVPSSEVAARILNTDVSPILDLEATPHESPTPPHEATASPPLLPMVLTSLEARLQAIERRQEAEIRHQAMLTRNALWWARLQGAIAGIVLLSAMLFLIWLAVYARPWW